MIGKVATTQDFTYYKQGIQFKAQAKYSEAVKSFTYFLREYPNYAKAYYFRGYSWTYLGDYENALKDFLIYEKMMPTDIEASYLVGHAYYGLKDYKKALSYFEKNLEKDANHIPSMNERGLTCCQLGRYDDAFIIFEQITKIDSTFAMAYNNAGASIYFNQEVENPTPDDLHTAADWFSKAIRVNPYLAIAYRNRGAVKYFLQEYSSAKQDITKALSLQPREPVALLYQAAIFTQEKNYSLAEESLQKCMSIDSFYLFAYEEMGKVYRLQNKLILAIDVYQKGQKMAKIKALKHFIGFMEYQIAGIYALQNEKAKMMSSLKKAKKEYAFHDRKLYQKFQTAKEFEPFRSHTDFIKFNQSLRKIKKNNDFNETQFKWFRMNLIN